MITASLHDHGEEGAASVWAVWAVWAPGPTHLIIARAVLPVDRMGAGSAVNTTVRQVGSVLGIAVLGTVLTVAGSPPGGAAGMAAACGPGPPR